MSKEAQDHRPPTLDYAPRSAVRAPVPPWSRVLGFALFVMFTPLTLLGLWILRIHLHEDPTVESALMVALPTLGFAVVAVVGLRRAVGIT